MKLLRHLLFYSVLVVVLFLSIGNVSLAKADVAHVAKPDINGEIQQDHQLNYDVQFSAYEMLLAQGNHELPAVNELRPNLNLIYPSGVSSLSILNEKVLMSLKKDVHITASLDGLTMIYPFHTFL